jgi:prepilin-type N-terminal cleavage/methylation domain-containing protein
MRRGFTLLEVMISIAILVTALVILMEIQGTAVQMTLDAERFVTATHLAQEKMNEVLFRVEAEGFGDTDIYEEGDFEDFGEESLDVSFGDSFQDFHWEYSIAEIDLGMAGDLAGAADQISNSGYWGEGGDEEIEAPESGAPDLSALGISPELITDMLGMYIREVRVRVWWGKNSKEAEELKDQVILVTHVINPTGQIVPGASSDASAAGGATGGLTGGATSVGR